MLTVNEMPKTLKPAVRDNFDKGREMYQASAAPFVMQVDSNLLIEEYAFYGQHRGPQTFEGEVRYSKLKEYSYTLKNQQYYDAMGIDWQLLKYAQNDRIAQKSRNFGYEWSRGIDKMAIQTLATGNSIICYDGTPFAGTSHQDLDSGVQSNLFTGGSGFSDVTFRVHAAALANFRDDRGEVVGNKATAVIVQRGTANAIEAKKLANSTILGTNFAYNPFAGFEVIEVDYLGTSTQFIVADLSKELKPVLRQIGSEMIFTAAELDSEWFMNHKQFRYAVHQDWAHGVTDWRLFTMQV